MTDGLMELRILAKGLELLGREVLLRLPKPERPHAPRRVTRKLRMHGRYLGLTRNLPAREKVRIRRLRERFGVERAIRAVRKLRAA